MNNFVQVAPASATTAPKKLQRQVFLDTKPIIVGVEDVQQQQYFQPHNSDDIGDTKGSKRMLFGDSGDRLFKDVSCLCA